MWGGGGAQKTSGNASVAFSFFGLSRQGAGSIRFSARNPAVTAKPLEEIAGVNYRRRPGFGARDPGVANPELRIPNPGSRTPDPGSRQESEEDQLDAR